ncbi:MAG: hypothetical protein HY665_03820, partial [Chloroflexi bacterium]|nr:hypothetical protein [Chloroflexota bacterium]
MATKIGTMTNEERLRKTIRLEKTDKILSAPGINTFAATYAGITVKEFLSDPVKAEAAYEKTFNELGGWDIVRASVAGADGGIGNVMRRVMPGRDLPDNVINQISEEEIMLPEDYDFAIENGFNALQKRLQQRMNPPGPNQEERQRLAAEAARQAQANAEKWRFRGLARLAGGAIGSHPFNWFSFHRSLPKFSMDVRRMPDKVKAAIKACLPDMIANGKRIAETTGCRRVTNPNARGSSTFISAKQFEEFVLPYWLEVVWAL